ncbi:MAG TPA: hypothetical protein VNT53_11595 [Pseudolysinimonas sp.]|nr:hypothetical protein [Pseudolysinimonas sp.]
MTRFFISLVLAVGLVVTTAACVPTPAPMPSNSADPSPSADPVIAPQPLLDIACSDLASASDISRYLVGAVTPQGLRGDDPDAQPMRTLQLRQLGGLRCVWSNGVTHAFNNASPRIAATVEVLPGADAAAKWDRYRKNSTVQEGTEEYYCSFNVVVEPSFDDGCIYNGFAGDAWVSIFLESVPSGEYASKVELQTATRPLIAQIAQKVAAAEPANSPWSPPGGTPPLPKDCENIVSGASVAAATESEKPVDSFVYRDGPQADMTLGLDDHFVVPVCTWAYKDLDSGPGSLTAWFGGEWAWREMRSGEREDMAGDASGAQFWLDCRPGVQTCTADLVVDHNWIRLTLNDPDPQGAVDGYTYSADKATALRTIAAEVLKNLE